MTFHTSQGHMTYARLYDLSRLENLKSLDQLESFDFMPCKAKLTFHRGQDAEDILPSHDDIEAAFNSEEMYISGQEDYHKYLSSRVVSHNHSLIRWKSTQPSPHIVDLGSTHGTYLIRLGSKISVSSLLSTIKDTDLIDAKEATFLRDGDIIQLGKAVKRAKEEHQPARLLVKIFTGMSKVPKSVEYNPDHVNKESDLQALARKYVEDAFEVEAVEDVDSDDINEDKEEDVTHIATRRPTDPLVLDQSDVDDHSIDIGFSDDEEGEVIVRESKEWRISTTAEEDEEDKEEDVEGTKVSCDTGDRKTGWDFDIESENDFEEEQESDSEVSNFSSSEQDSEDQQEKKSEMDQDMELHTDYEALIRADESYRQNVSKAVTMTTASEMVKVLKPTTPMAVEESAAPELSKMREEGDSSQEEVSESLQSSPVIDQEGDSSTDATSEAEEIIVTKEKITTTVSEDYDMSNGIQEVPRIVGKKRDHDEMEEAEVETVDSGSTRVQAQPSMSESPTLKKLKTFSAGLAAGILAGAVGTFVGLNSLVLNDASFL